MRLLLPALLLTLCGSIAQAQPDIIPPQQPTDVRPPVIMGAPAVANPPVVPRTGTPQEQIKTDLATFVTHLNANEAFMSNSNFVYGLNMGYFGANEWAKNWKALQIQIQLDDIAVEQVTNDKATVAIRYHAKSQQEALNQLFQARSNRGAVEGMVETLALRKEAMWGKEYWQIVPAEKGFDPANPETGIFAYVAYVLAQKGQVPTDALPYSFNTEGQHSIQNLKQLGLGVMQFVQDYDELYSFQPQYVQEALMPYIKSRELFRIPATQQSYTFNAELSGKSLAAVAEPARTVLLYEGEDRRPIFRYNGKAAIAFTDGHCALLDPEGLKNILWEVRLEKG